jgi:hypothetical protein
MCSFLASAMLSLTAPFAAEGFPVTPDPIVTEMMAAVATVRDGDRAGGRMRLEALLAGLGDDPDPFYACVLSHHMADMQDDLADELAWDLRALDAALRCADERHQASIAGSMSSLHASLATDYYKLGDFARSRDHLAAARSFAGHLVDDAYGRLVLGGIERLAKGLAARGADLPES